MAEWSISTPNLIVGFIFKRLKKCWVKIEKGMEQSKQLKLREEVITINVFFSNGQFPASFSLFQSIQTVDSIGMFNINFADD